VFVLAGALVGLLVFARPIVTDAALRVTDPRLAERPTSPTPA